MINSQNGPNDLVILYGSQTGNSEDLAKRIGFIAKCLHRRVTVICMDDFHLKTLPQQPYVLFVCSTTGHGQEPDNMKKFFSFMKRRDLPNNCLSNLKFAVYGLGDSSYAKFNIIAKVLFKRLNACGAQPLQELVLGDEQHEFGCDGIIYPKLEELFTLLAYGSITNLARELFKKHRSYSLRVNQEPNDDAIYSNEFFAKHGVRRAVCVSNKRITAESHFQDTRFLKFKLCDDDESLSYEPGDACAIYPANLDENVDAFIRLLKLDSNLRFEVVKTDRDFMINYLYDYIPNGLTIRDLVKYYLDIQSVPKRSFFEFFRALSTDDELEKEKLFEFSRTDGQGELYEYAIRHKRSILEVMADFPNTSKNVTLESLFDLIPPIKPRLFSIASAMSAHSGQIHLIVGVVRFNTIMRKPRLGLCSNYLASLKPGTSSLSYFRHESCIHISIRRSAFKLPQTDTIPIILIGPGLGLAPFRSFLCDRRARWKDRLDRSRETDKNLLYFGCRYQEKDYYLEDELASMEQEGFLRLRVALSRQEPRRKVQDFLLDDKNILCTLIKKDGAIVYVAGNSKLPEDVRDVLGKLLVEDQGGEQASGLDDRANQVIRQLEADNRIQYDCW